MSPPRGRRPPIPLLRRKLLIRLLHPRLLNQLRARIPRRAAPPTLSSAMTAIFLFSNLRPSLPPTWQHPLVLPRDLYVSFLLPSNSSPTTHHPLLLLLRSLRSRLPARLPTRTVTSSRAKRNLNLPRRELLRRLGASPRAFVNQSRRSMSFPSERPRLLLPMPVAQPRRRCLLCRAYLPRCCDRSRGTPGVTLDLVCRLNRFPLPSAPPLPRPPPALLLNQARLAGRGRTLGFQSLLSGTSYHRPYPLVSGPFRRLRVPPRRCRPTTDQTRRVGSLRTLRVE
jgi:hypothetical protein